MDILFTLCNTYGTCYNLQVKYHKYHIMTFIASLSIILQMDSQFLNKEKPIQPRWKG